MRTQMLLLLSAAFFLSSFSHLKADEPVCNEPWQLPKTWETTPTPEDQQIAYYDFIWRSFIALNWPNVPVEVSGNTITSGMRGKPDSSKSLKDLSGSKPPLTVWESYKEPFEVFPDPADWDKPQYSHWNTVRPAPPNEKSAHIPPHARRMLTFDSLTEYANDTLQPYFYAMMTGPLRDQQHKALVRYEVAVNRSFFTYIRHFKYYNAAEQAKAVWIYINNESLRGTPQAFQRPPFGNPREIGPGGYLHDLPAYDQVGLIDVKAAWRKLDPKTDHIDRYLHRELSFWDGDKVKSQLMGLVALHVLRWTPNGYDRLKGIDGGFVASTFEQIDNVTVNVTESGEVIAPSFNDGSAPTPEEKEFGFSGEIPTTPSRPVNVYRATAQSIPPAVKTINNHYQTSAIVKGSVLQYYQLIGTQNHHPGPITFNTAADRERNGPQGPTTGVYSNANNLVNSALESYTQKNFTCIRCHIQARPKVFDLKTEHGKEKRGIDTFPMQAFQDDHFKILTFLLQAAQFPPKKTK